MSVENSPILLVMAGFVFFGWPFYLLYWVLLDYLSQRFQSAIAIIFMSFLLGVVLPLMVLFGGFLAIAIAFSAGWPADVLIVSLAMLFVIVCTPTWLAACLWFAFKRLLEFLAPARVS